MKGALKGMNGCWSPGSVARPRFGGRTDPKDGSERSGSHMEMLPLRQGGGNL